MRPVRDWIANVALAALVAAVTLALVLPAQGQTVTWKVDGPAACTVTCAPAGAPIPAPPVTPQPPAPVEPTPPQDDPCALVTDARFHATLARQPPLNLMDYVFALGRGPNDLERACARARNVPGSAIPPPAGNSSTGAPTTGFALVNKGRPLTNALIANQTYRYSIPTVKGERVQITILEVTGTPDSMGATTLIRGPSGELLSGPQGYQRISIHLIQSSPGGTLTLYLTPTETAPLGVQRN